MEKNARESVSESTLVQILVVVVITKLRSLFWTEVENGSKWKGIWFGWVDPKRFIKYEKKWGGDWWRISSRVELKGKIVKILLLDEEGGKNFVKRSSFNLSIGI